MNVNAKDALKLLVAVVAIGLVVAVGGCICCCGLDSLLSKMKKPVSAIDVPPAITVDGRGYGLLYSYDYLNRSAAKEGFKGFITRIGYSPADYGNSVDQMMDVGGVNDYKWFEYGDAGGPVMAGGFLARASSPLVVGSGIGSLNAMLSTSMGIINDPLLNEGGATNLTRAGTAAIGDGADLYRFTADYNGSVRECYFVMAHYSNMYVAVYSFESFAAAEDGARQAIAWIDKAAVS